MNLTFKTIMYDTLMTINPGTIVNALGLKQEAKPDPVFPMPSLEPKEKMALTERLCMKRFAWRPLLKASDCISKVRFLNRVFTYNLFPTTHHTELTKTMAYVVDAIL